MSTVYVVFGTTGEYSDRTEWPVAAYDTKENAEQHIRDAEEAVRKANQSVVGFRGDEDEVARLKIHESRLVGCEFRLDYTGVHFYYVEVELLSQYSR